MHSGVLQSCMSFAAIACADRRPAGPGIIATVDAALAYAHFFSIAVLAALLALEYSLCGDRVEPADIVLLARIDAACIAALAASILTGVASAAGGRTAPGFLTANPVFWQGLALFGAIGILHAVPGRQIRSWRCALARGSGRVLSGVELLRVRRVIAVELVLLAAAVSATLLAGRGIGLPLQPSEPV